MKILWTLVAIAVLALLFVSALWSKGAGALLEELKNKELEE